jgi:heme/copper-type cytochrome/quinol oxidase subunit 3
MDVLLVVLGGFLAILALVALAERRPSPAVGALLITLMFALLFATLAIAADG